MGVRICSRPHNQLEDRTARCSTKQGARITLGQNTICALGLHLANSGDKIRLLAPLAVQRKDISRQGSPHMGFCSFFFLRAGGFWEASEVVHIYFLFCFLDRMFIASRRFSMNPLLPAGLIIPGARGCPPCQLQSPFITTSKNRWCFTLGQKKVIISLVSCLCSSDVL